MFPIIGGPVIAIIAGMIITMFFKNKTSFVSGIKFTSKKILQYAVVLLVFGLNLNVILETGKQSLPIILATISTSLILAFLRTRKEKKNNTDGKKVSLKSIFPFFIF